MKNKRRVAACMLVLLTQFVFGRVHAQWSPTSFSPSFNPISPFGYGQVIQQLAPTSSASGISICKMISPALSCISVSGGSACSSLAPVNSIVSCNAQTQTPVNEANFQPVSCNGYPQGDGGRSGLLGSQDWCLIANYMPQRTVDTLYQYDDYVRLGVNKRFGGMITELYGADKIDRILQNGGGGVQLSLWAFTTDYAPSSLTRAFFAQSSTQDPNWRTDFDSTPFQTVAACQNAHPSENCILGVIGPNYLSSSVYPCADNGQAAGAPFNPIQGISTTCEYGLPQASVDSVTSTAPGQVTVVKSAPANYTRSDAMAGLIWKQTSQVQGPAAVVTYQMNNPSSISDIDFQEIPAIFLHAGIGGQVYYYSGPNGYQDVAGPVSMVSTTAPGAPSVSALQLSSRSGPFGTGAVALLSEDWVSTCDYTGTKCVTIATFSAAAQDIIVEYASQGSYFGVHGFFSLTNQLNKTVTVFLFPYRFDDVVMGKSIRSWIYMLHTNPLYRR